MIKKSKSNCLTFIYPSVVPWLSKDDLNLGNLQTSLYRKQAFTQDQLVRCVRQGLHQETVQFEARLGISCSSKPIGV